MLEIAGLESLADRRYGQLSGGEKQRTLFALAMCGNPRLLFLDEPTVGMDVESRRRFWSGVRSLVAAGRSILLTTHYLEEADALASRIVVLNRGRIVADGTPASIKQQAAGRQVRCQTRLSREALLALPGVQRVDDEPPTASACSRPTRIRRSARCCARTRPRATSTSAASASRTHSSR